MNAPARLWTGEAVLDHALEVAGFRVEDLQRSMEVTREALEAETPKITRYDRDGSVREEIEGGPDHAIRLRASENIFGWLGLRGSRKPADAADQSRPVQIAIVLQQPESGASDPAVGLPPRRVHVHLEGHNGHAGNGRVRDAGGREDLGSGRGDDRPRPEAP